MENNDLPDDIFMMDDSDEDSLANKYLLFRLGKETYGISIEFVTDIIEMQKITDVPDMPEYVKGVINLRGMIIPVIDLRLRFGMEPIEYNDRTCIIIVKIDTISVGFIVDIVSEVHEIGPDNIDPPPAFKGKSGKDRYIMGLGKVENEVKILIDAKKIIREEELEGIEQKTG